MTLEKKCLPLVVNGVLHTLRLADIHRRRAYIPLHQAAITEINKQTKQLTMALDSGLHGFIDNGDDVMTDDEKRDMRRQMVIPLQIMNEFAGRAGADIVVLPYRTNGPAAQMVDGVISDYRVQGSFCFMRSPYMTDLSGVAPIDRNVRENVLYNGPKRISQLLPLLYIDDTLQDAWDKEGVTPSARTPKKRMTARAKERMEDRLRNDAYMTERSILQRHLPAEVIRVEAPALIG